ncbi:MAG: integrase [Betaproteobacteria bacterium]|nr:MAG: integrase [Betaproteobacteria bacterium]
MTKKSAPSTGAKTTVADESTTEPPARLKTAKNALAERVLTAASTDLAEAEPYIAVSHAPATVRAYASAARDFANFGGTIPTTAEFLCRYLAHCANRQLAVATIELRLTAIHAAHVELNERSPVEGRIVKRTMQGIRRTIGGRQKTATPILKEDLLHMLLLASRQKPNKAARDTALLLVGFASACRRSEVSSIRLRDVSKVTNGCEVFLPVSKTDQQKNGRVVFLPYASGNRCPVKALDHWIAKAYITEPDEFVFRAVNRHDQISTKPLSAKGVSIVVKASANRIDLFDDENHRYSAHGLRSGFVTQATISGFQAFQIQEQTGHRSTATVARYTRVVNRRKLPSLL